MFSRFVAFFLSTLLFVASIGDPKRNVASATGLADTYRAEPLLDEFHPGSQMSSYRKRLGHPDIRLLDKYGVFEAYLI